MKSKSYSMDDNALNRVAFIRYKLTLGNNSAAVRRALTLLTAAIVAEQDNNPLCFKDGSEFRIMPIDKSITNGE
jgi:hypothetical protein